MRNRSAIVSAAAALLLTGGLLATVATRTPAAGAPAAPGAPQPAAPRPAEAQPAAPPATPPTHPPSKPPGATRSAAPAAQPTAPPATPPGAPAGGPAGASPGAPAGTAPGGRPAAPPPPQNLQFLPKDIPRPQLIQTMRGFSFALGVRCEFCHVGEHDAPNGREDFAADQKPEKVTARAMLVMTKRLNEELLAKIPNRGTPPVEVTCVTCHHGQPKPQTLSGRLHAAMAAAGVDSAIAEVRHLHDNAEYGWFDLSEWGISEAAREFSTEGKNDEALALLHLNAEYNPQSTAIPAMMAEVQVARGDRAAAIEILHKLLAADPENRRAKRMLEQLEAPPKEGKQ